MLTAGTQGGGGGRYARSYSGEQYGCGEASDGGSRFPPRDGSPVSQRVQAIRRYVESISKYLQGASLRIKCSGLREFIVS